MPFEDRGGTWEPRYYIENAISKTLDAISKGQKRILLTLATGTGKTAIAFQISWKLFKSRWNLNGDGARLPRILFLADRNIILSNGKVIRLVTHLDINSDDIVTVISAVKEFYSHNKNAI